MTNRAIRQILILSNGVFAAVDAEPGTSKNRLLSDEKHARGRAAGVAVGLIVLAFIMSVIIGILIGIPLLLAGFEFESTPVFIALIIGGQIAFFITGCLYARRYGLSVPLSLPSQRDIGYALVGVVAALIVATVGFSLMAWADLMPDAIIETAVTQDPMVAIWMGLLSVFLIAPAEEYLCRGVIQGRLRNSFAAPGAILIASLLFGALHLGNYVGSIGTVVGGALLIASVGAVFGVLYEKTDTLTVPIIAHGVYNFILFAASYLML